MYTLALVVLFGTGMVLGDTCPSISFPITLTVVTYTSNYSNYVYALRFPTFVSDVNILLVKNGALANQIHMDEAFLKDATKATVMSDYGGGYFRVNASTLGLDVNNDGGIVCASVKVIQDGKQSICRMCKLVARFTCVSCSSTIYTYNARINNDGTGLLAFQVADLPITMNVECNITGEKMPMNNYYPGPATPGPYYYQPTPSPSSCNNGNAHVMSSIKTKLAPRTITIITLKDLKSNFRYMVEPTFEIVWDGTPPTDLPNPLPLMPDTFYPYTFSTGMQCPPK